MLYSSFVEIFDISDPAVPTSVGIYTMPEGSIDEISLNESTAYLSGSEVGIYIVDTSNPASPNPVGQFDILGSATEHVIHNNMAFLTGDAGGLWIVNITTPATPSLRGRLPLANVPSRVRHYNSHTYLSAFHTGLYSYNTADPTAPTPSGFYDEYGELFSISQDRAYYFTGYDQTLDQSEITILDISNPATISKAGVINVEGSAGYGLASGDLAYFTDMSYDSGNRILTVAAWDVTSPATPQLRGQLSFTSTASYGSNNMYLVDHALYIYPYVVNVSDPTNLSLAGKLDESISQTDITHKDDYLYVSSSSKLIIYDISNPISPTQLSELESGSSSVAVLGDRAYLGGGGVRIIDVSEPQTPTLLSTYTNYDWESISTDGTHLYVTDRYRGLLIYSVAESNNVTGHVTDALGNPVAGATVTAGDTYTATTDASGYYTITDVPNGTHTLVAEKQGYVWWEPAERSVTLPPNAADQNFVAHRIRKEAHLGRAESTLQQHVITYTLTIAAPEATELALYDAIPTGTTYITGSLWPTFSNVTFDAESNAITGTVTADPISATQIRFSVHITDTEAMAITNRACIFPVEGTMAECEWSNETRTELAEYKIFLPLVIR